MEETSKTYDVIEVVNQFGIHSYCDFIPHLKSFIEEMKYDHNYLLISFYSKINNVKLRELNFKNLLSEMGFMKDNYDIIGLKEYKYESIYIIKISKELLIEKINYLINHRITIINLNNKIDLPMTDIEINNSFGCQLDIGRMLNSINQKYEIVFSHNSSDAIIYYLISMS